MKDFFLLIAGPPPHPPFSLAIHVPKEKSKEMALQSIPSASLGFADSPYDVAISHQSPLVYLSCCPGPAFALYPKLIFSSTHVPHKLHCPQSYLQCKFAVAPSALFSFFLDRREEIVT